MKKPPIFALVLVCLSAVPSAAQNPIPAPETELAVIDPKAHNLLARLVERYKRFQTFSGVVEARTSAPVPWNFQRQRLTLERRKGAISTFTPAQNGFKGETIRRVTDGIQILETNASFSGRHTMEKIQMSPQTMPQFLRSSGADFTGWSLFFGDNLAVGLLSPNLRSLKWGAVQTKGAPWQTVEIQSSGVPGDAAVKLWIDVKNLHLRRVETRLTPRDSKKTDTFIEDYSEIVFDQPIPAATFSTQPPKNSRLVWAFPSESEGVVATPPMRN